MKSILITGSGQCGETFFYNLFKKNKKIDAFDETRPTISSYYKFIKYNKINIDDGPFFKLISNDLKKTNKKGKIRLETSSYLSLHIDEIYKKFGAKIIILLRNPYEVSLSLSRKGWYKKKYLLENKKKIIGYQGVSTTPHNKHHNFSRISPKGNFFFKWNKFSPMLKAKWYWNEIYKEIFKKLEKVPKKNFKIIKIEEFEYKDYIILSKWIGIKPDINQFIFNIKLKIAQRSNANKKVKNFREFSKFKSNIEKKYYKENINKNL